MALQSKLGFLVIALLVSSSLAWSEQAPVLLYDEVGSTGDLESLGTIGAQKYLIIYQDDCDPEAKTNGTVDVSKVLRRIAAVTEGRNYEWGVLDFETPFDDWLAEGPESDHGKRATKTMVDLIARVRQLFPSVKWTYYGVPRVPFYIDGKVWSSAPEEIRRSARAQCLARTRAVAEACDWLAPSVYFVVGNRANGGRPDADHLISTAAWTEATVSIAVELSGSRSAPCPVIPFASPIYQPGGGARAGSTISMQDLRRCTIDPAIRAGASGITCWTAMSYVVKKLTETDVKQLGPEDRQAAIWAAEDLGLEPEQLHSQSGASMLRVRLSSAVSMFMAEFNGRWKSLRAQPDAAAGKSPSAKESGKR
jgi:hypothetical protein